MMLIIGIMVDMCRSTDDPDDLCLSCYAGGWCWFSLYRDTPSLPVEEPAHLPVEEITLEEWEDPNYLEYWSHYSPVSLRARARASERTRARDN